MEIINFKKLAKNDLRRKALLVAEAGYEAVNIKKVIKLKVKSKKENGEEFLIIKNQGKEERIKLNDFKRVFVIGIGKGSALASLELAKKLGKRLTKGIALDTQKPKSSFLISNFSFLVGTHPLPSKVNIAHTKKIIDLTKKAGKEDLGIFFICGGGSALLCGSEKELNAEQKIFKDLTSKGADIIELNTVRKHISEVKGGGLAKMAYPTTVVSLIVSDVLKNNLASVASGPTVYDKTIKKDAEKILQRYGLRSTDYRLQLLETPKDKKYFKKVKNILFVSNKDAVLAMKKKAEKLGFKTKIKSLVLRGEAKSIFAPIAKKIKKGEAILAGGETTVRLKKLEIRNEKLGEGGRNQEVVLGLLNRLQTTDYRLWQDKNRLAIDRLVVISYASDGHDNTEAAGAIGDVLTIQKAKKLGLNPRDYLNRHDSFNFFKKTGDSIFAKKESFNVADLMILIQE